MRLYLSSFRLGARPERLVDLVRRRAGATDVAVIANALDGDGDPGRRRQALAAETAALQTLGLSPYEVDLRDYAGRSAALDRDLRACAALWVRGGNAFTLLQTMRACGADAVIARLIHEDALVYAGYSAGGCVLAPSLRGLELCDDPDEVRRAYRVEPPFDALGILDRAFVPHLDSPGHPETELLSLVAESYRRDGVPFWGLRDGQVLLVDGPLEDARLI